MFPSLQNVQSTESFPIPNSHLLLGRNPMNLPSPCYFLGSNLPSISANFCFLPAASSFPCLSSLPIPSTKPFDSSLSLSKWATAVPLIHYKFCFTRLFPFSLHTFFLRDRSRLLISLIPSPVMPIFPPLHYPHSPLPELVLFSYISFPAITPSGCFLCPQYT